MKTLQSSITFPKFLQFFSAVTLVSGCFVQSIAAVPTEPAVGSQAPVPTGTTPVVPGALPSATVVPKTEVAAPKSSSQQPGLMPAPVPSVAAPGVAAPTEVKVTAPVLERKMVLKLRERRVYLYQGDQALTSFPVAVGKPGWETPKGNFKVMYKVVNPTFENPFTGVVIPPGPNNPLGDRLIVFAKMGNKGYAGFHGTTNESLIGQAVSHGCVRMKNRDIRALFEKIEVGTTVVVVP
jgi:L,D-transpeptidase YnhG